MTEVSPLVEELVERGQRVGLDADELLTVARAAVEPGLKATVRRRLLKALNPRAAVPSECAVQLMGAFFGLDEGSRKTVLKWISLVLPWCDDPETMHQLFPVFFHYLDYAELRPLLCHILCRITRASDVLAFRARRLAMLYEKSGRDIHVLSLLLVFRDLNRNVAVVAASAKRPILRADLSAVNQLLRAGVARAPSAAPRGLGLPVAAPPGTIVGPAGGDSGGYALVRCLRRRPLPMAVSVPEHARSLRDVAQHVRDIRLPSPIATVVGNRLAMTYLQAHPSEEFLGRLGSYLSATLYDLFIWREQRSADRSYKQALLDKLATYGEFLQELPAGVQPWLFVFLRTWDGISFQAPVLRLLSLVSPMPFEEFSSLVLRPLHWLFVTAPPALKARLLQAWTAMLQRWLLIEPATLETATAVRSHFAHNLLSAGSYHLDLVWDTVRTVGDDMGTVALRLEHDHPLVQHALLSMFDLVSGLYRHFALPMLSVPPTALAFSALLSGSAAAVARMCAVFVEYKVEVDAIKAALPSDSVIGMQDLRFPFNSVILDYVDLLTRALSEADRKAAYPDNPSLIAMPAEVLARHTSARVNHLNVSRSFAFLGFAARFLFDKHGQAFTVEALRSVRGPLRFEYADFLAEHGLVGVRNFLRTYLSSYQQAASAGAS